VEGFSFQAPLRPGDALLGVAEVERRFGPLMRVKVWLRRENGEELASGTLLLSSADG
jgi:hypothetical protein